MYPTQASGKGAAPAVAEGLGGINVQGVEDPKTEDRPGELSAAQLQQEARCACDWLAKSGTSQAGMPVKRSIQCQTGCTRAMLRVPLKSNGV